VYLQNMKKFTVILCLVALMLGGYAYYTRHSVQMQLLTDAAFTQSGTFACLGDKTIGVAFADRVARISLSDKRVFTLGQTEANDESGIKYSNGNEIALWIKDDSAFVEENGLPTYEGCRVASEDLASAPLCFIYNTEDGSTADVVMNIQGDTVSGTFAYAWAEKDSKGGSFKGTISPPDPVQMTRVLKVWWDSESEGKRATEELYIRMEEGIAVPGFGEMKDRGDGVYVYASPDDISYGPHLSLADCKTETVR
jgi:hypothetical protein